MQIGSEIWDVDVEHIVGDVEDHRFREELRFCQQFLVDSELERARHKLFNYAMENLNAKIVDKKLDDFFSNVKCAAKVIVAFVFILRNIEEAGFTFFYAHENNTLLDRSKLECTRDELVKPNDLLNKTDVKESCGRERTNTKWRFYKLTNLVVFAVLLKDVPLGCKDAVLPEALLRKGTINCLSYEEQTRQPYNDISVPFSCACSPLQGNQRLEEEFSTLFFLFISRKDGLSTDQFQGVRMNDHSIVEDLVTLNILLYDKGKVFGNNIGDFARRSVQKYGNTVRRLTYNNHICYVNNINAVLQSFPFNRTFNLGRQLTTCNERVKNVYLKNVYKTQKTNCRAELFWNWIH